MSRRKAYIPKNFENNNSKPLSANLYAGMLQSPAFMQLNKGAQILYVYMKLQYYGQKPIKDHPNTDFYFNEALIKTYELYTNMTQFRKDRDSLIQHGFIEYVECGKNTRTRSIYRFSDKWQTWEG